MRAEAFRVKSAQRRAVRGRSALPARRGRPPVKGDHQQKDIPCRTIEPEALGLGGGHIEVVEHHNHHLHAFDFGH
jgi:hypothetical protein